MKLMLVDDDEDNLILMRKALTRAGYTKVITLSDPLEASAVFCREQPDMVILDYRMPPVDGFYVLREIRANQRMTHHVPVIMLTAGATEETKQRALEAGVTDFLNKDFDFTELILRIRNALHTHLLNRQLQRQNELLEETVRVRTMQIHQAHRDALAKLAIAAEFRDDQTGEHTRRVGYLASRIAEAMGMPRAFVEDIRVAAPLHDVGKIGIPDDILLKAGPLTNDEYEKVKAHARIGERILGGSEEPIIEMARDIALTHHERWDGNGYPNRYDGEAIPISGRIVAVADAYDAITNDRHYKKALAREAAVTEIQACSGRHFDPSVVEAFMEVIAQRQEVLVEDPEELAIRGVPQYLLFE